MKNREIGGRYLKMFELDKYSIQKAYAPIPLDTLKFVAQMLRERDDWTGLNQEEKEIYKCLLEVIRISEPEFNTIYIEAV